MNIHCIAVKVRPYHKWTEQDDKILAEHYADGWKQVTFAMQQAGRPERSRVNIRQRMRWIRKQNLLLEVIAYDI